MGGHSKLLAIQPETGKVVQSFDLPPLFVTGKLWPTVFEIKVIPEPEVKPR
jgi:glutamine cyclotransferase